jgi:hypothetical protein
MVWPEGMYDLTFKKIYGSPAGYVGLIQTCALLKSEHSTGEWRVSSLLIPSSFRDLGLIGLK